MATMRAPEGVTQISVEQQNFQVKDDGTVVVPDNFADRLKEIGFTHAPTRIAVSPEAAAAIAEAAAKLGLPDPSLSMTKTVELTPEQIAANVAAVKAQSDAADVPFIGEAARINGSPREVVEAAAIEDPVERQNALDALSQTARQKSALFPDDGEAAGEGAAQTPGTE
jgi:hypothetical protein